MAKRVSVGLSGIKWCMYRYFKRCSLTYQWCLASFWISVCIIDPAIGRSLVLLTCDCMSVKTLVLTMSSDHNRSSSNQNAGTFLLNSQSAKSVICWSWGALSSVNISLKESLRGWPDWLSVYLYPETRRKHQQSLRQYHVHWSASNQEEDDESSGSVELTETVWRS